MSQSLRPTLAALIGAATLTAAAPAVAAESSAMEARAHSRPSEADPERRTLGGIIEARLLKAQEANRYEDIDALATLWMNLERRGQLDRRVERGEQFINVALRNQRRSELRSEARRHRHTPFSASDTDAPAPTLHFDQALDAERFISGLQEPYRTAILWSLTGRNHREVAQEMGASHAAVRKWAQRLRESLGDE